MDDVKSIVAKNITELRLLNNMTQLELAEKLNYSDKTISKWERGESTPDIAVLVEISRLFGVTLDYLVSNDKENIDKKVKDNHQSEVKYNRRAVDYTAQGLVWVAVLLAFVITTLVAPNATFQWLYFVYALPVVTIIKLVFNSIWFNPRANYMIISVLMWSVLAAIQISFWYFGMNISIIYLLGIAGEMIIIFWSFIKRPKKASPKDNT